MLVLGMGFFSINIPNAFAQSALDSVDQTSDPIASAERALVLEEGAETAPAPSSASISIILRMLLTLALAAAAIYGVIYFIKRASRRQEVTDPFLKVLAGVHLGSNRYAHVVALGSRAWLLGSAEGGVELISEIEDKDILNAMFLADSRKIAGTGRFPDFRAMLSRLGMSVKPGAPPNAENIRKRRERLKGL